MRHAIRLALGFVFLLGAGTALAQPPGTPRAADYFPLNKGTKWVYKVGDTEVTVVVAGTERFNDEDCVRVETRVGSDPKIAEVYTVRPDGVYRVKVKDDLIIPPVKVLPIPVKAGDSWAVNSKLGTQNIKGTLVVKSTRERVMVPAGEFETVFVEGKDLEVAGAKSTVRIWFARNRGIVKEAFVLQSGETVVLELAKFEPGEVPAPPPVTVEPAPALAPVPVWAFPQRCRILLPQCTSLRVTTQECCGCCARSGRLWVRRR
jgi:hypothetical protein